MLLALSDLGQWMAAGTRWAQKHRVGRPPAPPFPRLPRVGRGTPFPQEAQETWGVFGAGSFGLCSTGGSSAPCRNISRPGPGMAEVRWEPRGCRAGTLPQSPRHLEGKESLAELAQPDAGIGTSQDQQVRLGHGQLHWHIPMALPPPVTPLSLFHATRPPMAQLQQQFASNRAFPGNAGPGGDAPFSSTRALGPLLSCPSCGAIMPYKLLPPVPPWHKPTPGSQAGTGSHDATQAGAAATWIKSTKP